MTVDTISLLLFPALMAFAACSDLLTMRISNRLSVVLVGAFFMLAAMTAMSPFDILSHVATAGLVLVAAFACFARGWIGGADAKLASATALWLGYEHLSTYLVCASLCGGALTLMLLQLRMLPLPARLATQEWVQRLHANDGRVPYGIALAAAALIVYPHTQWMS